MKKLFFLSLVLICGLCYGQTTTFTSTSMIKGTMEFQNVFVKHNITINNDQFIVSKLWNGGTEDAVFKIDRIEIKASDYDGQSTYYYLTDSKEDVVNGKQKAIAIKPKYKKEITLAVFADETTVFKFIFLE